MSSAIVISRNRCGYESGRADCRSRFGRPGFHRIPAPTDTKDVIVIEHAPWLRRAEQSAASSQQRIAAECYYAARRRSGQANLAKRPAGRCTGCGRRRELTEVEVIEAAVGVMTAFSGWLWLVAIFAVIFASGAP